jgi:hypothetical protein
VPKAMESTVQISASLSLPFQPKPPVAAQPVVPGLPSS